LKLKSPEFSLYRLPVAVIYIDSANDSIAIDGTFRWPKAPSKVIYWKVDKTFSTSLQRNKKLGSHTASIFSRILFLFFDTVWKVFN
jgi:hypothetical protein